MDKVSLLLKQEERRQRETLMMIPSENYTFTEARKAVGSVLMHKYSEGYPKKRYYQGNNVVDQIETVAIERVRKIFNVPYANVQSLSGSPANTAVYFALLDLGDTIMGMEYSAGGHLTHGMPKITFSGRYFRSVQFGVNNDGYLDYEEVEKLVNKEKPKLMIVGTTAYPFIFNWKKFERIADSVGAWLIADISHEAGLIAAGVYPSPVKYAHVISSTTHKTLRGPRGALIMVTDKGLKKDPELGIKIDRAVFPGLQGGPHNNVTAGIAITLEKVSKPEFKKYAVNVIENAKYLAILLKKGGLDLVGGKTQNHLILVDLRSKSLLGNVVAIALEAAGIVVNKNAVPNDPMPAYYPSGIRLGTPAVTARGMGKREMKKISNWILDVVDHVSNERLPKEKQKRIMYLREYKQRTEKDGYLESINKKVKMLCRKYPLP
jgi:glycine hydroxymethyltransferase